MNIIIAGDLVPTQSNYHLFNNGDVQSLLGKKLSYIWNNIDYKIFNLETPLMDQTDPIEKCGPNLIAPTSTIHGINALNPTLVMLANNHILDQGHQGLSSTIEALEKNKINYIGAGIDINNACKACIIKNKGIKVGIYACVEHEFSIATSNSSGANPFDPFESFDHINSIKSKCDYVIVIYHGGKEHYRYPSPYLQKVCRKIVDKGADLVVCQHSHCIGCYEKYEQSTIIYGQGNFIFDRLDNDFWKSSILINVTYKNKHVVVDYIPIVKKGNAIRLAEKEEKHALLSGFHERSHRIKDKDFINDEYDRLVKKMSKHYLLSFYGNNMIFKIIKKLFGLKLIKLIHSKNSINLIKNIIECETHREILLKALNLYIDNTNYI